LEGADLDDIYLNEASLKNFARYFNLGVDRSRRGDKQKAIKAWTQAIQLNPQNTHAYYNRGVTKAEIGDFSGALQDFNKAIQLNHKYLTLTVSEIKSMSCHQKFLMMLILSTNVMFIVKIN
jgi:tetratricopeptide (TPR) repeat protein